MLERLGDLLYWVCTALAVPFALVSVLFLFFGEGKELYLLGIAGFMVAILIWGAGLVMRNLVAGK